MRATLKRELGVVEETTTTTTGMPTATAPKAKTSGGGGRGKKTEKKRAVKKETIVNNTGPIKSNSNGRVRKGFENTSLPEDVEIQLPVVASYNRNGYPYPFNFVVTRVERKSSQQKLNPKSKTRKSTLLWHITKCYFLGQYYPDFYFDLLQKGRFLVFQVLFLFLC